MVHDAWFHAKFDHCRRAGISADRESGCVTSGRKVTCTKGDRNFVVCMLHKAKPILLTAKALPCTTHSKGHTANNRRQRQPLSCAFCRAHNKEFAVCTSDPRQKILKNIKQKSVPCRRGSPCRTPPHMPGPTMCGPHT